MFYYLLPATLKRVKNKNWWHEIRNHLNEIIDKSMKVDNLQIALLRSCGLLEYSLHIWRMYGLDLKETDEGFYSDLNIKISTVTELKGMLNDGKIKWQEQFLKKITKQDGKIQI